MSIESIGVILVGLLLLTLGRRLFWVFVGATGFFYGLTVGPIFFPTGSSHFLLLVALACGLVGAVLSLFLQKLAVGLAGAIVGGVVVAQLGADEGAVISMMSVPFLIGAVLGAMFVLAVFDWALVIWSSVIGAAFVLQPFHVPNRFTSAIFFAVVAAGIIIQATFMTPRSPDTR